MLQIQPGKWIDKVVPSAWTTKDVCLVGSKATLEADFEVGEVKAHNVHHQLRDGVWAAVHDGSSLPSIRAAGPIEQLCEEFKAFLSSVESRNEPIANVTGSGFRLARLMETIYRSSELRQTLAVDYGETN